MRWNVVCVLAMAAVTILAAAQEQNAPPAVDSFKYADASRQTYLKFAAETESMLHEDVLEVWFPRSIDNQHGGFYSVFSREWKPGASQGKFSVFQGRMTWIASEMALRRPETKDQFLPIAEHGLQFLNDVLWDKQYGGFFWGVDDQGGISDFYGADKDMYGESFGLYGVAAAYQATHDPKGLELAKKEFRWMEEHTHDAKNGGYFELLTREGHPVEADANGMPARNTSHGGFLAGYKSMNTHIHLLEAISQLYEVWKDDTVKARLQELLAIVRDKVCVEPGVMNQYFTNDWRPIPDHDSYGHDVETAYLMLEAEDVLGVAHDPRTERMAKMLVDHAIIPGAAFVDDGDVDPTKTKFFGHRTFFDRQWMIRRVSERQDGFEMILPRETPHRPGLLPCSPVELSRLHDGEAFREHIVPTVSPDLLGTDDQKRDKQAPANPETS